MSSSTSRLAQLRELLPDASLPELQDLVRSSTSLEHAVALHFSKHEQPAHPLTRPAQRQQRVEETIDDDDDAPPTDTPMDGGAGSNGEEQIQAEEDKDMANGDDQRPSTPSSPRPSSLTTTSPGGTPRKARAAPRSQKRKAPGSGSGSGSGGKQRKGSKRARDQRSIASFFGAGGSQSRPSPPVSAFPTDRLDALRPTDGSRTIGAFTSSSPAASSSSTSPRTPSAAASTAVVKSEGTGHEDSSDAVDGSTAASSSSPSASSSSYLSVPPLVLATSPPCWSAPAPVPYLHLARTFRAIEVETGRILITNLLALMLWRVLDLCPADLLPSAFLSLNHIAPPFENLQLHLGGSVLSRVIRDTTGRSRQQMHDDYVRLGDLGDVAQLYRVTQPLLVRPGQLSVRDVYARIYALSRLTGTGVTRRKEEVVRRLLIACREYETTYIVRSLLQNVRIGGAITTVLAALAKAVVLHAHHTSKDSPREHGTIATWERVLHSTAKDTASPMLTLADTTPSMSAHPAIASLPTASLHALIRTGTSTLRRCYSQHPNFRTIVGHVLSHPLAIFTLLSSVHLDPGTPCKPMLGKISKGLHDMLRRLRGDAFSCEIKYDGLRAQIHLLSDGRYRVFSRHLMEQTERWRDLYPLLDRARRAGQTTVDEEGKEREEVRTFIVDAEIVAVEVVHDPADASVVESFRILPFQAVTTRKRKVDGKPVDADRTEVTCMVYVFDLILLNDRPLLELSLPERRALLRAHFVEVPAGVQFVEHIDVSREESVAIAVEEEDDETTEDEIKQIAAVKKGSRRKDDDDADDGDSASEDEPDALPTTDHANDDDDLFSASTKKKTLDAVASEPDDDDDVTDITALTSAPSTAPTARATAAKLEALSEEAVERGAAAYTRILRFLHDAAIVRGEGLMAKSLAPLSTYEPDIRTDAWVKLKRDYIAGLSVGDSLDVVPIGGWWGNGRKAGWYSPVLLAVWNEESECLESLCKCMSGFTDVVYAELVESFAPRVIPKPKAYYVVHEQLTPSVWFDADRVWEVRGADLTISPKHSAARGLVDDTRGISLRFPRFIRAREDKAIEDATTSQQVAELYRMQSRKGNSGARGRR